MSKIMDPALEDYLSTASDEELADAAEFIHGLRKNRAALNARRLAAQLVKDDRVVFTGGKPKYLTGEAGTVIEKRGNKVLIQLDRPQGKFSDGRVLAPLTLIRKTGSL